MGCSRAHGGPLRAGVLPALRGFGPASLRALGCRAPAPLLAAAAFVLAAEETRAVLREGVDDVPTKGGDFVEKQDLTQGFLLFSAEEREVLLDALAQGHRELVTALVLARRRTQQRRDSDAETDAERRLLVGARVSRKRAERFRRCAQEHGMSLYRFVCSALEREYRRLSLTE